MACSPDGSQSVWKRTLSAASAVATKTPLAAKIANARIADFMLSPRQQASDDRNCSRRRVPFESKIAAAPARLCLDPERRGEQRGATLGGIRPAVPACALLP